MNVLTFPGPVTYGADDRTILVAAHQAVAMPLDAASVSAVGSWIDGYLGAAVWQRLSPIIGPHIIDTGNPVDDVRDAMARVVGG